PDPHCHGIGPARSDGMHRIATTLLTTTVVATLAACTATGDPTSSALMLTPSPDASESAGAPSTASPTLTPSSTASSSTGGTGFDDEAECENPELGYEVEYPADWWANERIDPG